VAPVPLGVDVAEVQARLEALVDASDASGDLASDEGAAAARRLVVEENAVREVHAVRLAVVDEDPVRVLLRDGVRRAGVEGSLGGEKREERNVRKENEMDEKKRKEKTKEDKRRQEERRGEKARSERSEERERERERERV